MKQFKFLFFVIFLLKVNSLWALTLKDLRAGDVVLLSLNCYECRMIESETESLFSHSGVVVIDEEGNAKIAQSIGRVAMDTFTDFTKNKTPGTFVHVYRPRELKSLAGIHYEKMASSMRDNFNSHFKGAPFDSKFAWNNFNSQGEELLYCSEFIAKFLDFFLSEKTKIAPISYSKHYDYWFKYFRGNVPLNELGNSPASFSRDSRFEFVGKI